jgi:hypothetical protein
MADYTVKLEGRVVLARWSEFKSPEEAEAYRTDILAAVDRAKPSAVICADWSRANITSPQVSEVLLSMLRGVHPRIERSSVLLAPEHAMFNLQAERLLRDAGASNRRSFRDSKAQIAWLSEVLQPNEQEAVKAFLP